MKFLILAAFMSASLFSQANVPDENKKEKIKEDETVEIIKKVEELDKSIKTLSAKFMQKVTFKKAELSQEVEGYIKYRKPENLKIVHEKPQKQIIIINSKKEIIIVKPQDKQIVKTSWEKWKTNLEMKMKGLLEIGNYSELLKKNNVKVSKDEKNTYLIITPKQKASDWTLKIKLNKEYFPVEGWLELGDTLVETKFINIEKNIKIKDMEFSYKNKEFETIKL